MYCYRTVIPLAWSVAVLPIMQKNEPFVPDFNFLQFFVCFLVDSSYRDACLLPLNFIPIRHTTFRISNIDIPAEGLSGSFLIIHSRSRRVNTTKLTNIPTSWWVPWLDCDRQKVSPLSIPLRNLSSGLSRVVSMKDEGLLWGDTISPNLGSLPVCV